MMSLAIRIIVTILVLIATVMLIVCTSTDFWQKTEYKEGQLYTTVHSGLWSGCYTTAEAENCNHIHREHDWLKATRAFMIISIIFMVMALCWISLSFINDMIIFRCVAVVLLCAGVFSLIGLAIYTAKSGVSSTSDIYETSFDWSFIVGWIGWVLVVIAALVGVFEESSCCCSIVPQQRE